MGGGASNWACSTNWNYTVEVNDTKTKHCEILDSKQRCLPVELELGPRIVFQTVDDKGVIVDPLAKCKTISSSSFLFLCVNLIFWTTICGAEYEKKHDI